MLYIPEVKKKKKNKAFGEYVITPPFFKSQESK